MADLVLTTQIIGGDRLRQLFAQIAAEGEKAAKQMGLNAKQSATFMGEFMKGAGQSVSEELKKATNETANLGKATEQTSKTGRAAFTSFRGTVRDFIQTVSGTAALLSLFSRNNEQLQGQLTALSISLQAAGAGMRVLFSAMKLVVAVIGAKVAAIAAAIGAVAALIFNWEKAKAVALDVWGTIAKYLTELWGGLGEMAAGLGEIMAGAVTIDVSKLGAVWNAVVGLFVGWFRTLGGLAQGLGDMLIGAVTFDNERFQQGVDGIKNSLINLGNDAARLGKALSDSMDNDRIKQGQKQLSAGYERVKTTVVDAGTKIVAATKKFANNIYMEYLGGSERQRALISQQADFDLRIGRITHEQRIKLLNLELKAVTGNTEKMLQVRSKIVEVSDAAFSKQLEQLKRTSLTTDEYKASLITLADTMDTSTDRGQAAFHKLRQEIEATITETEQFWRQVNKDMVYSSLDATRGIYSAFQKSFVDIFTGATSFGDGMKGLFKGIVQAVLAELAKVAAARLFASIVKPESILGSVLGQMGGAAGATAFAGTAAAGAEGLTSGLQAGLQQEAVAESLDLTSLSADAAAGSLTGVAGTGFGAASGLKGVGGASLTASAGLIGFSALLGGLAGGKKKRGLGVLIGAGIGLAFGNPLLGAQLGGALPFQHGGDSIVTRPTLMAVGEMGPESISVRPLTASGTNGGGVVLNVSGPLIMNDLTMAQFMRQVMRGLNRETGRYG